MEIKEKEELQKAWLKSAKEDFQIAEDCKLILTEKQMNDLREMTTFHIEARYDVIKDKLYKKATKEFTLKYFKITKKLLNYFISLI